MNKKFDIIVVGGGPAGLTAGIYCARAGKSVLVLEKTAFGGKIVESPNVENIPGFTSVSGVEFADSLYSQSLSCGVETELEEVLSVTHVSDTCVCIKTDVQEYECTCCIIASGTKNRTLGIAGEESLIGNAISFCVTCDGPFYEGKTVAVIGGGNSAITEAIELSEICKKVYIIQNLHSLTAEESLVNRIKSRENVEIRLDSTVLKYNVDENNNFVGVTVEDGDSKTQNIIVDGVFMAVGLIPQNDFVDDVGKLGGYITVDYMNRTSKRNIFACGDCTNEPVKQVAVACGSGARAALFALDYLKLCK